MTELITYHISLGGKVSNNFKLNAFIGWPGGRSEFRAFLKEPVIIVVNIQDIIKIDIRLLRRSIPLILELY